MECIDTDYHCLCAYLLDGEPSSEEMKIIEADPELCPRCRTCDHREVQLELQRGVRSLVQEHVTRPKVPYSLRRKIEHGFDMIAEYREFGTQVLDITPWGTHVAQFYNTSSDISEVLVPYMEKGLRENELCVWITAEMTEAEAKDALAKQIPDLQDYITSQQLQLFSYRDWYLSDGSLDIQNALAGALGKCQEAMSSGYSGLRATGNISWLESSDWSSFMDYESLLDDAVPEQKALILCVYKESKCTKANIADVIDRHKYAISKMDDSWRVRRAA
ncbi:MEDS domain-containing protein [Candidatus Poribacteria bacterium]